MHHLSIVNVIFLIFTGAAILSTFALFTRQSLIVAYMALGALLGPWGFQMVKDSALIREVGDIGIIFLLFLLGLHLQPQNLLHSLRKMSWITLFSSALFFGLGYGMGHFFHLHWHDSLLIGTGLLFSSTIIGLKLLPTSVLHHQHNGELMISILLLQDIIAIGVLLALQCLAESHFSWAKISLVASAFPILLLTAYVFQRYIIVKLLNYFDTVHEYVFILSIGWCLCMAKLSRFVGLPEEIGAFIAGVALASSPISLYIAESLKPLRDFFLVIFFFTVGAGFHFDYLPRIIWPALTLAGLILVIKPCVFSLLLQKSGESRATSWEIGIRLGQMSEFTFLIISLAMDSNFIMPQTTYLIQAASILSFIGSCYWVSLCYPTPFATTKKLKKP